MDASALYRFSSGLYVVSSDDGERPAGCLSPVPPMTYAYYHGTLKGKTPPKASSYVGV